jgi:hypothetical protein
MLRVVVEWRFFGAMPLMPFTFTAGVVWIAAAAF